MAAPVVSGIAGLLLGANLNLKNYGLEWIIKLTATDLSPPGVDDSTGYGRLNADTAVSHHFPPYELIRGDVSSLIIIANDVRRSLLDRPGEIAPGRDVCGVFKFEQTVSFPTPYAEARWGWCSLTGYNNVNPIYCEEYLYRSSTTTSITRHTYFHWAK